ncbi:MULTISPECIES: phosphopantothenate--cysteine ligase family flavoprotein [unclassified Novosphingobium]|uniref:bifunctional phosphopantothenoylcysteine decarboxylase/phosphopantothenate synthase n=1 Tax=unclassified Novosphingobium TaxID=2644732 RepID=UPI00135B7693|nr:MULTISPECIES: bifunctional phosphopantothenoylcysteine decarboxylase/phosphopantothenate synthase [unclassified Novosphingobium]
MNGPRILLVVGGGIAAYKSCELVRTIRKEGGSVTCVLTEGGAKFVTPMTLAALSENPVHTTLWDLRNEAEMGHIQLSREADLVVVCPATADLMAKMAAGIADDLATTLLLATDKPVMAIPAMNVRMWQHAATTRNVQTLRASGVDVMEPDEGPMACGEFGPGRLPEVQMIWQQIASALGHGSSVMVAPEAELGSVTGSMIPRGIPNAKKAVAFDDPAALVAAKGEARPAPATDPDALGHILTGGDAPQPFDPLTGQPDFDRGLEHRPLYGRHVLVTAGPTHEPIDPVRYIANRSSGKQGFAIAAAAAEAGARVTLIAGPVHLPTPPGVERVDVESALEMAGAVEAALPADIAVMVAAVADWRVARSAEQKLKNKNGGAPPALELTENPDILATLAKSAGRPRLVIGFAAETQDVIRYAREKRVRKGADWIIANDVSGDVMGGDANTVHIVTESDVISLPEMPKEDVARILVERFADALPR